MAKFTVQMTFETPLQRTPLRVTHRLPGRTTSLQILAADGTTAVTASGVRAQTPAEAAMVVVSAVNARWLKSRGPLTMCSWSAHRERVLVGRRGGATTIGRGSSWLDDDGWDEGGSAGVREPRRPKPGPGSLQAARDLPGPQGVEPER